MRLLPSIVVLYVLYRIYKPIWQAKIEKRRREIEEESRLPRISKRKVI